MIWVRLVWQTTILWLVFQAGTQLVARLHLHLPGNVVGMILLFILLMAEIIKPVHIQEAVNLLLKHFAFFFIPISVGLMSWSGLFYQNGVAIVTILTLSALVALIVTGGTIQLLMRKSKKNP